MPEIPDYGDSHAPNLSAGYFCAALQLALQHDKRATAEALFQPEADAEAIRLWVWQEDELEPSYLLARQGSRWMVAVRGTTNAPQWFHHFRGSTGRSYDLPGNALVHSFHHAVEHQLFDVIRSNMPPVLAGTTVHICGHSYGASLAFLLSNRFASTTDADAVQLMTFGEPRALTNGYRGELPDPHVRWCSDRDIVTEIPPGTVNIVDVIAPWHRAITWANRLGKAGKPFSETIDNWSPRSWKHYGPGVLLDVLGRVEPYKDIVFTRNLAIVLSGQALWVRDHLMVDGYAPRLLANADSRVLTGQDAAVVAVLRALTLATGVPTTHVKFNSLSESERLAVLDVLGWTSDGPSALQLRSPAAVAVRTTVTSIGGDGSKGGFFLGGGGAMALWDVGLCVSNDKNSKVMTISTESGGDAQSVYLAVLPIVSARAALLGRDQLTSPAGDNALPLGAGTPVVEFVRVVDRLASRVGQVFNVPRAYGNPPSLTPEAESGADPLWNCVTMPMFGVTGGRRVRSQLTIVGQPDAVIKGGALNTTYAYTASVDPKLWTERFKVFINLLTSGPTTWGFSAASPGTFPGKTISAWSVNAGGELVAACIAHGFQEEDRVRITRTGSPYASQEWYVHILSADSFSLKGSIRFAGQEPSFGGRARLIATAAGVQQLSFYRFEGLPDGWKPAERLTVSRRKPGRRMTRVSFGHRGSRNS